MWGGRLVGLGPILAGTHLLRDNQRSLLRSLALDSRQHLLLPLRDLNGMDLPPLHLTGSEDLAEVHRHRPDSLGAFGMAQRFLDHDAGFSVQVEDPIPECQRVHFGLTVALEDRQLYHWDHFRLTCHRSIDLYIYAPQWE